MDLVFHYVSRTVAFQCIKGALSYQVVTLKEGAGSHSLLQELQGFFCRSLIYLKQSCGSTSGRGRTQSFAYEENSIVFGPYFGYPCVNEVRVECLSISVLC